MPIAGLVIRSATEADAPVLLGIYAPFVENTAVSFELAPPSTAEFAARIRKSIAGWAWLVAERDGRCVGYAYGSVHRERPAYRWSVETSAYIAPDSHRLGIGSALYRALFAELAAKGYCNAFAGIALPNEASVALHRGAGFEPIGVFRAVGRKFGRWHDVAWFQRRLRELPPPEGAKVELSVYAPGGVRSAVQGAAAAFERETGHAVRFTFGTGGAIQEQVAAGAPADVAVLPSAAAAELDRRGLVCPGSRLEVGSVGIGVGIRAGAPRPRIGTAEEFRDALLAAGSITYADPARGGTSGTYFATVVLPRLGIAEPMRAKTALTGVGEEAVRRVANGESELVIVQASEITAVPGAELAGPLPKSIQSEIPYAAVALKATRAAEAAVAFVRHLVAPPGRAAFKAAGFEPPVERQPSGAPASP